MRLQFTTWNVFIQDGNFDDFRVNGEFTDNLSIGIKDNFTAIKTVSKTSLHQIKFNLYNMTCYVYKIEKGVIFVESSGLYFTIDTHDYLLQEGKYYSFIGEVYHDIWNWIGLDEYLSIHYYDELKTNGVIQSIHLDTSKPIKLDGQKYFSIGIKPIYNISVDKTSAWEDEEYTNCSFNYLLDIEIDDLQIERKRVLIALNNLIIKEKEK